MPWRIRDARSSSGSVLGAVLALNRDYQPHRLAKWQRHLLGGLEVKPANLTGRLHDLWSAGSAAQAVAQAESLLAGTAALAEATAQVSLGAFREALAERRPAIDPH
jgi:hypothetical protein